ncbi:MAG: hypothetical protein HYT80_07650 [Euryarchaeota archaeon]|nr:hypothetical protein [Euryarchaeota archaeon]
MRFYGAALALGLLTVVPPRAATEPFVLIEDPKGDAGPPGRGLPAGAEFLDVVEVGLADETATSVKLRIQVAAASGPPPFGEVAVHFRVNGSWWLVGWTTILFPAPPFTYKGGFYCPAEEGGVTDASKCDGFPAVVAGNAYVVTMDRAILRALDAGVVLDRPKAYGDVYNPGVRFDETAVGKAFTFARGNATPPVAAPEAEPSPPTIDATAIDAPAPRGSAPGPGTLVAVLVLAVVAWRRR